MAALAVAGVAALPTSADANVAPPQSMLQTRVAAIRAALSPLAADSADRVAQAVTWTNWPKWSKWSNWANK